MATTMRDGKDTAAAAAAAAAAVAAVASTAPGQPQTPADAPTTLDIFRTIAAHYDAKLARCARYVAALEDRAAERDRRLATLAERYSRLEETNVVLLERLRDTVAITEQLSQRLGLIALASRDTQTRVAALDTVLRDKHATLAHATDAIGALETLLAAQEHVVPPSSSTEPDANNNTTSETTTTTMTTSVHPDAKHDLHPGFLPRTSVTNPPLGEIKAAASSASFFDTHDSFFQSILADAGSSANIPSISRSPATPNINNNDEPTLDSPHTPVLLDQNTLNQHQNGIANLYHSHRIAMMYVAAIVVIVAAIVYAT